MTSPSERDPRAEDPRAEDPRTEDPRTEDLRAVLHGTGERVPEEILRAAKAAFTWRTVDEELASLQHDSLLGAGAAAVRSAATATAEMLLFESAGGSVLVQVIGSTLTGQLLPAAAATVEVVTPLGVAARAAVAGSGFFTVEVPASALRLRLSVPGAVPVLTPWFRPAGA